MLIPPSASWVNDFSNKTHNLIDSFHKLQLGIALGRIWLWHRWGVQPIIHLWAGQRQVKGASPQREL